jgi:hypothetical protein
MKIKITVIESGVVEYATDDIESALQLAEEDYEEGYVMMTEEDINSYDCEIKYEQV